MQTPHPTSPYPTPRCPTTSHPPRPTLPRLTPPHPAPPHNTYSFQRIFLFFLLLVTPYFFYNLYSLSSSLFGFKQLAHEYPWGSVNFILSHIHHECLSLGAVQKLILPQATFLLTHSSPKSSESSSLHLSSLHWPHFASSLVHFRREFIFNLSHEHIL